MILYFFKREPPPIKLPQYRDQIFCSAHKYIAVRVSVDGKPGRETALRAARSHKFLLWTTGSSHWDSPLQMLCPHCARLHTGELEDI